MSLNTKIESLLFVSTRPLSVRKLAELSGSSVEDIEAALNDVATKMNDAENGIQLVRHAGQVQLVSNPTQSKMITEFLKEEQAGELTRPALETLTIIAYRGPISKIQLDTIRGVNCALILRNLMIKGLVEAKSHKDKYQTSYQVTLDFIRHLGLQQISDLPNYEQLNRDERLEELLNPKAVTTTTEQSSDQPAVEQPTNESDQNS